MKSSSFTPRDSEESQERSVSARRAAAKKARGTGRMRGIVHTLRLNAPSMFEASVDLVVVRRFVARHGGM